MSKNLKPSVLQKNWLKDKMVILLLTTYSTNRQKIADILTMKSAGDENLLHHIFERYDHNVE